MKELEYPFDNEYILKKKKSLKKQLLENDNFIEKNIAILGGSTTSDIKLILELFLLNQGCIRMNEQMVTRKTNALNFLQKNARLEIGARCDYAIHARDKRGRRQHS